MIRIGLPRDLPENSYQEYPKLDIKNLGSEGYL